jgi:hypothetical protein
LKKWEDDDLYATNILANKEIIAEDPGATLFLTALEFLD